MPIVSGRRPIILRRPLAIATATVPVSVNATGVKQFQGVSTTSFNYTGLTVAPGSNTAIVASLNWDMNTTLPTGVSVVWGTQALTLICSSATAGVNGPRVDLWGLAGEHGAVATGNQTLAVSWTNNSHLFVVGMAFDHVNQTGGASSFPNSQSGSAAVTTYDIVSTANDMVMAGGDGGGIITGTTIYTDNSSGSVINSCANYDTGNAPTRTIGTSSAALLVATAIKAA